MTSRRIKALVTLTAFAVFFVYANVTADTPGHEATVSVLPDSEFLHAFTRDIAEAEESIYIAVYMFKSYENESRGIGLVKKLLMNAADRGVEVFVILEHSDEGDFVEEENRKLGDELKKHNIKVAYDAPDNRLHSKCAVIDRKISYIGSHNYTASAVSYNSELTARIVSEGAAQDVLRHIRSIR